MDNTEWALTCAKRGWLVFPSYQKRPLVRWGTQSTTDHHTIRAWFDNEFPMADVCIKTGVGSNLVVVDWDGYKILGGLAQFPLTPYPFTYTTETAKGGTHFYFKHPGYPVANSAGVVAQYVDVRGDGGMVVAYKPVLDRPLIDVPAHWVTERTTITEAVAPVLPPYEGEGDGMTLAVDLLQSYAQAVLDAPEGTLNTTLWQKAADAFKMVAQGELREESVTHLLMTVAVAAGHPAQGARETILSARNRGLLEPTTCVDLYWKGRGRA